jgi:signal transduction histidine kinase
MSARRQVLVVDDNPALAENLREILDDAGFETSAAASCAEARAAAAVGFNVALIDVKLPDGDGTKLAAELKQLSPDSQVILLTGHATVESAASAVRAGAWAYLVKPYDTADLLQTIGQAARHVELLAERRQLARRAEMAERMALVGTMTAGLSHEIKNPLNAAALQLTVLERRVKQLPQAAQGTLLEPLVLVRDEIERLNHTLNDFLQFARPRALQPVPVALEPLVQRVTKLLRAQAEEKTVSLREQVSGQPVVMGEDERLQQVLMNLLINAIQATPAGGEVMLAASAHNAETVVVSVDDSGPGIPEAERERVFEPFFTTKASGSGLGLPIVQAIIIQHGGRVRVEGSSKGGARFVLELPRAR